MQIRNRIPLFLLLCALAVDTFAQQLYLRHFTVDEGLPSNEVYQVTEDVQGNLLIATDRGAARFDGYAMEPLRVSGEKTVTPVYYLHKDKRGMVYFSGLKGQVYTYRDGRLSPLVFRPSAASQHASATALIANTLATRNDSLWISYNSSDYPTNLSIGTSLVLPNGRSVEVDQPAGIYFDFQKDFHYRELRGKAWPGNARQTVNIRWADGTTTRDSVNLFWPTGYVRRLYAVEQNGYTALCIGRWVYVYQNKQRISSRLLAADVLSFSLLSDGSIGAGMMNGGVAWFRLNNGVLEGPLRQQLAGLSVTEVYEDRQKGLWFSTVEDGLYYGYPARTAYWEGRAKLQFIDKWNETLVVGYDNGELEQYQRGRLLSKKKLPFQPEEFLIRFSFQPDGKLVVATNKGYHVETALGWQSVRELNLYLLPVHSRLVYGTDLSFPELRAYEGYGGRLLKKVKLPGRVVSAFSDSSGALWLGTWQGLYVYCNDSLVDMRKAHPAFADRIVGIGALPSGWMAVATLGSGLVLQKGSTTVYLTADNGLPTAIINSLRTGRNAVYLGTNKGITAVQLHNEGTVRISQFARESGLPTLDVHQFAVTDGDLYGKWVNRLFHFSLKALEGSAAPLAVYLQSVQVQGKPVDLEGAANFDHHDNSFEFRFNSVNLSAANQQTYVYRLVGFENREHETRQRVATYTNLPPGHYAFSVRVLDGRGQVSAEQVFGFRITPAFWQTAWFPWLLGLLLMALAYGLFRWQLRVAKRKHQLHLQLAESNQRALVQLINPHFISNLLNTVYAAVLKGNKLEAGSVISRFAKLMRLTMEVGKDKFVRLEQELELIREYLALEQLRAPEKFDWSLQVGADLHPDRVCIPGMLIQPFVENAVKHGLAHLPHKGQLNVIVSIQNDRLVCRVEDNGIGIENARKRSTGDLGNHRSAGISITVNRLMLLHQQSKRPLLYEVGKKSPDDEAFPGTVVLFSLPFKYAADT